MSVSPHPIASLKAALKTRLLATANLVAIIGQAVYSARPRVAAPPFIVIGDAAMRDHGGVLADNQVIDLDLLIVTRERAEIDALTIASVVETALADPLPVLAGHRLVSLETTQTLLRHDAAGTATQAAIRLRAMTEPL